LHITTGLTMADMGLAALLIFAVIFIKPLITSIICLLFGYGERTSLLVGLGMGQISEFSFLIASTALAAGIFTQNLFSVVTIAIIFTIVLTPYVFKYGNVLYVALDKTRKILRIPEIGFLKRKSMDEKGVTYQRNHVVIVGCDRMGGRLLEKLRKDRVFITDFNPDIIRSMKAQGVPCVYGDAFSDDIVEKMNLPRAAVVVSTIPDHRTTLSLIARAKKANRHVIFIAHANRPEKALEFYEAGADVVVMPESVAGQKMAQIISLALQAPGKLKEIKHGHLHWLEHDISKEQRSKKLIRRFINVHDRQYGGEHVSPQQKTQALRKKFTDKRMQVHAKKQH